MMVFENCLQYWEFLFKFYVVFYNVVVLMLFRESIVKIKYSISMLHGIVYLLQLMFLFIHIDADFFFLV